MAIHFSTPPVSGGERPRLPSAQVGPVTRAIRAMRGADASAKLAPASPNGRATDHCTPRLQHAYQAIAAIEDGLASFFAKPVLDPRQFTHGIRALSRTDVENLVEGLVDLLDAWDGDTDCEHDEADGPEGDDEREGDPADDGIGDYDGLAEQVGLALSLRAYA